MIRRLRCLMGFDQRNWSSPRKVLTNHNLQSLPVHKPSETIHEVAIYIDRFHNLDLFQQGWYQIKVSLHLEGQESTPLGTPARVVQYEEPRLGCEGAYGIWRINDADNSFLTQPFYIKYSRQDVYLSIMISFILSLHAEEGAISSAVILKFELMYTPLIKDGSQLETPVYALPAAVHEFRIPPKALLGLHSYCPIHFDAFYAVLLDASVHIIMLKATCLSPSKDLSQGASPNSKQIVLIKALLQAHDIFCEDIEKVCKAIDQVVDLGNSISNMGHAKFPFISPCILHNMDYNSQASYKLVNGVKKVYGRADLQNDAFLYSLSRDDLSKIIHSLENQILFIWNQFLTFHRANRKKILDYLHDTWAEDRRVEWSIWMVYSKDEVPPYSMSSQVDSSSCQSPLRKLSSPQKLAYDPAQWATMHAELHRQSIAQMRINNRSLQDMHMFGNPSCVPIVTIERVVHPPLQTLNGNIFLSQLDQKDTPNFPRGVIGTAKGSNNFHSEQDGKVLKIVVFVHGFQGHHLDLRLIRNQWLLIDPKIEFLMSEANENKTHGDFKEMGVRLAQEVVCFIKRKIDKASRTGRLRNIKLSFVGHSIGNVILRAALTESILEPYLRYLHTYLSLSGPHLGYMYSSNTLFNSGLWLLKKFKGTQCIHQLTFSDDPDLTNTFLYKLCKEKTLENFKNIILLSSPQDGYIPYHSARIDMSPASMLDYTKRGKVFWDMLSNCLNQIQAPSSEPRIFMRCDISFDTSSQTRNLNAIIGRAAHVEFLESDIFARLIMWSFPELFC
ncbi:hypothetical protein K2173_015373 [Erythroxylum novogranatense]|uniref:DUF676 domain-containing protein n=1 Tax=Erythroxylum novogranatense TaxID=1862640 RepID=A0AAV8SS85_9ROSI|nr:hypothetical protein K2173_015373 [Erythroxylum novogranatense]